MLEIRGERWRNFRNNQNLGLLFFGQARFKNEIHVCPQLALKIPHLRSVRLRMYSICRQIFDLKDCDPSSKIESIIIDLSLRETDPFSTGFSYHCTKSRRAWELYNDMVHAAEEFANRMLNPSLKVLRTLCHKHPSLEYGDWRLHHWNQNDP